ncbi:MAG: flagellar basal body L-ring protein FlgH [Planctomycetota bacterium]
MMRTTAVLTALAILAATGGAQSLYEQTQPERVGERGRDTQLGPTDGAPGLRQISLYHVEPPQPRQFLPNDLVTVIISERARTDRRQELETLKEFEINGSVTSTVDLLKLLELRLQQGRDSSDDLPVLQADFDREYIGESEFRRDDTVTARVTARVVEVKPNGNLLLEARTSVRTDTEEQVILLSGTARGEDVTNNNTVQSNQLFDLTVDIQNTGQVKDGSSKGLFTRVLDTIFNF